MERLGRAVTMLRHDDIGLAGAILFIVEVRAMHEEHHVGVLLNRTGFTQIGQLRLAVVTHFRAAVQLAQRDDRHLKLLRKQLQGAGEFGNLLLTAFHLLAGTHELQVIDHHEFQVVRLLESAAFRADFHQAHIRAVVDEQGRVLHLVPEIIQRVPPFRRDVIRSAQRDQRNVRLGGDDTLRKFHAAHLKGEDDSRHIVMQRCGTRKINAERGLAHGRAAGDDNHLARLQALRHVVDIAEAGRHAAFDLAVLQFVELVECIMDHRADGRIILTDLAHAHLVDLGLGHIHDVLSLRAFRRIAELRDFRTCRYDIAQNRALMHDFGVIRGVCGGRDGGDQAVEVIGAADLF